MARLQASLVEGRQRPLMAINLKTVFPRASTRAVLACVATAMLAGTVCQLALAEPMWTTYHRDAERSGYDPEAMRPIEPSLAWQTPGLGAPIWNQPLVLGKRVYVATVGDELYALEASTGELVWQRSLGTPVPSDELPCGDIQPTVGVVGTPVIDPTTQTIYMVADTWDEATHEARHLLEGVSLATGEIVLSTPADPPGADPKALLQRTALNLDKGDVVFGFGGNDGDCGDYQGAVAAIPENGDPPLFWQYKPALPSLSGGAVWATSGPAVDAAGNVYATTGNPNPPDGEPASTFDYSDSVLELNPAQGFVKEPATEATIPAGWFEPPNWEEESNNDLDLSSAGAELLPGEVLFQAGKDGVGYLIDDATMNAGAPALFKAPVCEGAGSFGGDAYASGTLYIPCTNGMQALAYNATAQTFTPLWKGPSNAFGSPIVAAGLIWVLQTGGFVAGGDTLYGLDISSGEPRYTETLPSPIIDHFSSPSEAGGRLFIATGASVTSYQIAKLSDEEAPSDASPSEEPPIKAEASEKHLSSDQTAPSSNTVPAANAGALAPALPQAPSIRTLRLHASPSGRVVLKLHCPQTPAPCSGSVTLQTNSALNRKPGKNRSVHPTALAHASFGPARGNFQLELHLDKNAMARLRRHKNSLKVRIRISVAARLPLITAAILS